MNKRSSGFSTVVLVTAAVVVAMWWVYGVGKEQAGHTQQDEASHIKTSKRSDAEDDITHPDQSTASVADSAVSNSAGGSATAAIAATPQDHPSITLADAAPGVPEWFPLKPDAQHRDAVQPQITQTEEGWHITFDLQGFSRITRLHGQVLYSRIAVPGFTARGETGRPDVPMRNLMLELPERMEPVVTLTSVSRVNIEPLQVWPVQPLPMDGAPEFEPPAFACDPDIYAAERSYPEDLIVKTHVGRMRNRRILSIQVTPMQVYPAEDRAAIADHIEIDVTLEPAGESRGTSQPLPAGLAEGSPGKYMVLMDDQFSTNAVLSEFVEWKKRKGYDVTLLKTSDIDAGGAPTNGQIVAWLRSLPAESYPEYLLIIGDHTANNGVQGTYYSTWYGGWSDLYLACRDGGDFFPDLCTGRLPARDDAELTLMLSKALAMDRSPPTNRLFQKVCVAGQIQDYQDSYPNEADRLFCETADSIACYFEQDAGGVDYDCVRAMVNPNNVTASCAWNYHHSPPSIVWSAGDRIGTRVHSTFVSVSEARTRLFEQLNRGIILLQHRDHGGITGWGDPDFDSSDVRSLTNGVNRPAVFSINCLTGSYHENDNFTRAWLQHVNGGAYAVFSPTDVSYSWLNDWLTHGFYTGFLTNYIAWHNAGASPDWPVDLPMPGGAYGGCGSAERLGQILNFGKMYMAEQYAQDETTFRLFHMFGDPESYLQLQAPAALNVVHDPVVGLGTQPVRIDAGVEDALVCLYSEPLGLHLVTNTTAAGCADFQVSSAVTGTVHVTVTGKGLRPYEGVIEIAGSVINFSRAAYEVLEDAGQVMITVERSGDTNQTASVDYVTVNASAMAGADYTAASGTLNFAPGVMSQSFAVPILNETEDEQGETFCLSMTILSTDTVFGVRSNAVVYIEDDDGAGEVMLAAPAQTVDEAAGSVTVAAVRRNGLHGTAGADYATTPDTASAGQDYTETSGTLNFADGQRTNTFAVPIVADVTDEPDEQFTVSLSSPTGGMEIGDPAQADITITDDDTAGVLNFSVLQYHASETGGTAVITVERSSGHDGPVTVDFATLDKTATAGMDYVATNGTLLLGHAVTAAVFRVAMLDDADEELSEKFGVQLSRPGGGAALGARTNADVVIYSDEAPRASFPMFEDFEQGSLSNYWALWHSDDSGHIEVTALNAPHSGTHHLVMDSLDTQTMTLNELILTINLAGREGVSLEFFHKHFSDDAHQMPDSFTGHSESDGVALSVDGTNWYKVVGLTSYEGISSTYQSYQLLLDNVIAQHGLAYCEDVRIKFQQYDNYDISIDGFAFDDIRMRQNYGDLSFAVSNCVYTEGDQAQIQVLRKTSSMNAITVDYTISNGTAVAGSDFAATNGTLTFADGVTHQWLDIPLLNDGRSEGPENFYITLCNPSPNAAVREPGTVKVRIDDREDPGVFGFSGPEFTCREDCGIYTVTVERSESDWGCVDVGYVFTNGTAVAGADYVAAGGTVTFADAQTSAVITVTLLNDSIEEFPETMGIVLNSLPVGARYGTYPGTTVRIHSDEVPDAELPFYEGFESGTLSNYWQTWSSTNYGHIEISTNYSPHTGLRHVVMASDNGVRAINELILCVDAAQKQHVDLSFWHCEYGDENNYLPLSFTGHAQGDGVAVSGDGHQWYKVQGLTSSDGTAAYYRQFSVTLDDVRAAHGLTNDHIYLKFQQTDDFDLTTDGFAFDDIALSGEQQDDLDVLPYRDGHASGYEGGAFYPDAFTYSLTNAGASAVNWTASTDVSWVEIPSAGGALSPGGTSTVQVAWNTETLALVPGEYTGTVTFANTASGNSRKRVVYLSVAELPDPPPVPFAPQPADSAAQVDLDADLAWNQAGERPADIQILAFTAHADMSDSGEYRNLLAAISEHFTDFDVEITSSEDPAALQAQLMGKQVFLIPEQESWSVSGMRSFGMNAGPVLQGFVQSGGRVIVCDYSPGGGACALLQQAGLMNIDYGGSCGYQTAHVVVTNALTEGMNGAYTTQSGSTYYHADHDGETLINVPYYSSSPVAVYKTLGGGSVILIGHDYYAYTTDMGRLAANAVSMQGYDGILHKVYFGTQDPPVTSVSENLITPALALDRLTRDTDYYWQVVSSNVAGCVTGPVWTFTTMTVGDLRVVDSIGAAADHAMPYGDVIVGSWRDEQVTLSNTNPAYDLAVTNITISGAGFSMTNVPTLPLVLTPGGAQTVDVRYRPSALQAHSGFLSLWSHDEDEPCIQLALSGAGIEDYLHVEPETAFETRGHPGGPFDPDARLYTLRNEGDTALNWSMAAGTNWLQVAPASGTLFPSATQQVVFSVGPDAALLPEGAYETDVVFSNHLTGMWHNRKVIMTVFTSPETVMHPQAFVITNRVGQSCSAGLQIGNTGDADLDFTLKTREIGRYSDVDAHVQTVETGEDRIVLDYTFAAPVVTQAGEYDAIELPGLESFIRSGRPVLPVRPVTLLIPFGRQVAEVHAVPLCEKKLEGVYLPAPGGRPQPLSLRPHADAAVAACDPAVYGGAAPWPAARMQTGLAGSKRGYRLQQINLFPVIWQPAEQTLWWTPRMRLEVTLRDADTRQAACVQPDAAVRDALSDAVDNPDALSTYPAAGTSVERKYPVDLPAGGPYECVIITTPELEAAAGPYNFQALRDAKNARGVRTLIVTTNWICTNYSGTRPDGGSDDQTRIRNFLTDAYQAWGTRYVLLGGAHPDIPARMFWVDPWAGSSYATTMPVDMYYGCVDPVACTFDADADGVYGEPCDGVGGGDVDLYGEMCVGRAAVEDVHELAAFVRKTLAYECSYEEYLANVVMVGEHLGFGGVAEYAKAAMEQIRMGGEYDGYFTYGFENNEQARFLPFNTRTNLYDQDGSWSKYALLALMNQGQHVFNHLGHANKTYDMKLYTSDLSSLTNDRAFFAYSQGCNPGWLDSSDCFAEQITTMDHGAFAVIMNARYGWGTRNSTDGPSQRFDRQFWDAVLSEDMLEIGRANQDSKEDNLWDINGDCIRWCYYELNLFGDPEIRLRIEDVCDWMTLDTASGTVVPGAQSNVNVTFDATELPEGTYEGLIMLNGNDVTNPVVNVPVTMYVLSDDLMVTPAAGLDAQAYQGCAFDVSNKCYTLRNCGNSVLSWSAACSQQWVSVTPGSGTLQPGETKEITVAFNSNARTLTPGNYTGFVTISNTGSGYSALRPVQAEILALGINLIENGSFETQGTDSRQAYYWQYGYPDSHGGKWGTAARQNWRHTGTGAWCGTICGSWISGDTGGGWWQDARHPVRAGRRYRLSGWFFADTAEPSGPWTSAVQQIQIEFRTGGADTSAILRRISADLRNINEIWQYRSIEGTAPEGTEWVRVVIHASGVADKGALQFDDLKLEYIGNQPLTRYVAHSGSHTPPFTSWASAATNIMAAVDVAHDGNTIIVDDGTWMLDQTVMLLNDITLQSRNGSGSTVLHGQDALRCVCMGAAGATVEGFTITRGSPQGDWPDNLGGGVFINHGGTLRDCRVCDNNTEMHGGGAACFYGGLITNCTFSANTAAYGGGGVYLYFGGQLLNSLVETNFASDGAGLKCEHAQPVIRNCVITENHATGGGAGIDCPFTSAHIGNCRIISNHGGWSGGIVFWNSWVDPQIEPVINNCIIAGNYGSHGGGMICCGVNARIRNTTIANNTAGNHAGGLTVYDGAVPDLANSIVWGNAPVQFYGSGAQVAYSCVQGGYAGNGIVTGDPCLQSGSCNLQTGSSCIDQGSDAVDADQDSPLYSLTADLDGVPRPLDGNNDGSACMDIGAHEYVHPVADTDHDGLSDKGELETWNTSPINDDCDGDGQSDGTEIIAGTGAWDSNDYFTCDAQMHNNKQLFWQGISGRLYTVQWKMDLHAEWEDAADFTNVPGMDGTMSYTNQQTGLTYYRVRISMDD